MSSIKNDKCVFKHIDSSRKLLVQLFHDKFEVYQSMKRSPDIVEFTEMAILSPINLKTPTHFTIHTYQNPRDMTDFFCVNWVVMARHLACNIER